jgi:hypothetical protein
VTPHRPRMGKIGPHRTFQCPVARDNVIVERVVKCVLHRLFLFLVNGQAQLAYPFASPFPMARGGWVKAQTSPVDTPSVAQSWPSFAPFASRHA